MQDALTKVSAAQVLGTGATLSTFSIPLGAAVRSHDIEFEVNVSGVSGTGPTLKVEVIGADDGALTSNVVSMGSIDPVIAAAQAADTYYVRGSIMTKKAFVGLRYTMAGTTPACTVSASATIGKGSDYSQK
jgi:hypothetical protein